MLKLVEHRNNNFGGTGGGADFTQGLPSAPVQGFSILYPEQAVGRRTENENNLVALHLNDLDGERAFRVVWVEAGGELGGVVEPIGIGVQ